MILTNIGLWFFLLWIFNVFDPSAVGNLQLAVKLERPGVSLAVWVATREGLLTCRCRYYFPVSSFLTTKIPGFSVVNWKGFQDVGVKIILRSPCSSKPKWYFRFGHNRKNAHFPLGFLPSRNRVAARNLFGIRRLPSVKNVYHKTIRRINNSTFFRKSCIHPRLSLRRSGCTGLEFETKRSNCRS